MEKKTKSYSELLKDSRWQNKRLEILQRDGFTCQLCGSKDKPLNVHHIFYKKDVNPWDYENDDLITLCEHCHNNLHENVNIANMKDVKIGDVFLYEHSDYDDYLMCYDIDYKSKTIYLAGMDNGSGDDGFWVFGMSYDYFKRKCDIIENFFDEYFYEDYRQQWLLGQIYCVLYAPNRITIHDYDVDKATICNKIKCNLPIMRANNKMFSILFEKTIKGDIIVTQIGLP